MDVPTASRVKKYRCGGDILHKYEFQRDEMNQICNQMGKNKAILTQFILLFHIFLLLVMGGNWKNQLFH